MIEAIVIPLYFLVGILAMRPIYGRLRTREIEGTFKAYGDPVKRFNEVERGEMVFGSVAMGLFWPLAITVYALYRYITYKPRPTELERETRELELQQRIKQLERELNN